MEELLGNFYQYIKNYGMGMFKDPELNSKIIESRIKLNFQNKIDDSK